MGHFGIEGVQQFRRPPRSWSVCAPAGRRRTPGIRSSAGRGACNRGSVPRSRNRKVVPVRQPPMIARSVAPAESRPPSDGRRRQVAIAAPAISRPTADCRHRVPTALRRASCAACESRNSAGRPPAVGEKLGREPLFGALDDAVHVERVAVRPLGAGPARPPRRSVRRRATRGRLPGHCDSPSGITRTSGSAGSVSTAGIA